MCNKDRASTSIELLVVRKGFTLIELLVVIAIISLLTSILMPSLGQAKELAKRVVCMSHLKQYGLAIEMYRDDYNGDWPDGPRYASPQGVLEYVLLFPDYISSKDMKCPADTPTAYTNDSLLESHGVPEGVALSYTYAAAGFCWAPTYNERTPPPLPTYRLMFDYAVIAGWPPHGGAGSNCLLVGHEVKWIPEEEYANDYFPEVEP
ncbi:MAG: type II secretion system protein [Planctomycetota bacterium]|nr:type II secretion system protein [Planctomycetota bacterium]